MTHIDGFVIACLEDNKQAFIDHGLRQPQGLSRPPPRTPFSRAVR